jgi:cation diffusion facilitator CzcD-associated flavoprotein CzcO
VTAPTTAVTGAVEHHEVVIVGAGFSGLGAAIRCKQAGIHDLVLLDRGDSVGGTWRDNTYPGAAGGMVA